MGATSSISTSDEAGSGGGIGSGGGGGSSGGGGSGSCVWSKRLKIDDLDGGQPATAACKAAALYEYHSRKSFKVVLLCIDEQPCKQPDVCREVLTWSFLGSLGGPRGKL